MTPVPSLVQVGAPPSRSSVVRRLAPPPAARTIHRSPRGPRLWRKNAIHCPSGDSAGNVGSDQTGLSGTPGTSRMFVPSAAASHSPQRWDGGPRSNTIVDPSAEKFGLLPGSTSRRAVPPSGGTDQMPDCRSNTI
jgi:hypothetical protein